MPGVRVHFSTVAPLTLAAADAITDIHGLATTTVVSTSPAEEAIVASVGVSTVATSTAARFDF
jgi:hypothetical protein